ncbi:MAG: permease, partial [Cyanobacteria bacterium P01_A01_bin.70]
MGFADPQQRGPALATMGNPFALTGLLAFATVALLMTIFLTAARFADCTITAAGAGEAQAVNKRRDRTFASMSPAQALRRKEWQLLARDPWLASQTVMQVLYLIPPAILLWRDNSSLDSATIATP